MPAYNAEKTLEKTFRDIPKRLADEIILVDDASNDNTVRIAKRLGITTFVHKKNLGYGANQKTCYKMALSSGADIVVMLHPDYQYDARFIEKLVKPIVNSQFDIMLGTRLKGFGKTLSTGMPLYKYLANIFLTWLNNLMLDTRLTEYHTGFRAYTRDFLKSIDFNNFANDHLFDLEILIEAIKKKASIGEVYIPGRYLPESSSMNFIESTNYGIKTLVELFKFSSKKLLPKDSSYKDK